MNSSHLRTLRMANLLVDAGLLTSADLHPKHSLKQDIEATFAARFTAVRPHPLVVMGVFLTDDIAEYNLEFYRYAKLNNLPDKQINTGEAGTNGQLDPRFMGAFSVHFDFESSVRCEIIGPALNALEAWPRLGQSVLNILHTGLEDCTRSLNPCNSLQWASREYWQSEDDESSRVEEELEEIRDDCHEAAKKAGRPIPTDEEIIATQIDIFTRAKLEQSIPARWHRFNSPLETLPLTLGQPDLAAAAATFHPDANSQPGLTLAESFAIETIQRDWPAIRAACETIQQVQALDHEDSNQLCESALWDSTPFILRMDDNDCLPRIFDDTINTYIQCGDGDLGLSAVFLWHDVATLQRAMTRCTHYLQLTQACEDLIRLLTVKPPVKIPVRV